MSNKKTKKSGLAPQGKKFDKGGSNTSEDTKKADEFAKYLKKILLDSRLPEEDRKKAQSMIKRFDKGGSNMSSAKFQFAQRDRVGKSLADAKANNLMFYKGKDGKKKAAVSKTDLIAFRKRENNPDLTLRDYLNKMQGKTRRKDTKKTIPVIKPEKPFIKRKPTKEELKADKKKNKPSTSVGAGAVKTIAGTAAATSATEINRKLREKAKGEKTDTKTKTKTPVAKDKPSLLKRIMTKKIFPTKKQEEKRAKLKETFGRKQKPTVTSQYKKEMSYNMGGSVKVKMSKGGFKGTF